MSESNVRQFSMAPIVVEQSKFVPLTSVPQPPSWLPDDVAFDQWASLCAVLIRVGCLNEGVLPALAVLCALHSDIVNAYRQSVRPSPAMLTIYRGLLNDFALTPVAQQQAAARVKAPEAPKPKNPFGRFGRPGDAK